MSVSFMTPVGDILIPSGGVTQDLLNRITDLETKVQDLTNKLTAVESSRAGRENYGLVKLSDATTVTQTEGLALSATEKNASINGTLANAIEFLKNKQKFKSYPNFASVPLPIESFEFYIVQYYGADSDAPITTNSAWWWNCISLGVDTRATQIAFSVFVERGAMYIRQKHDAAWTSWHKITGTVV